LLFFLGVLERSRFKMKVAYEAFYEVSELGMDSVSGLSARASMALDCGVDTEKAFQALRGLIADHPDEFLVRWLFAIQCRA